MTYETYRYIFLGGLIAAAIFLAISVVLFFVLNIPKVVSDLSGRTARKAIESIRKQNEESGNKVYQSSTVNMQRGRLTDKISQSGRLITRSGDAFGVGSITTKIATQKLQTAAETDVLSGAPETDVLCPAAETDVLSYAQETSVLSYGQETSVLSNAPETAVLNAGFGETSLLAPEMGSTQELGFAAPAAPAMACPAPTIELTDQPFTIEYEITFIHTNEVIS